MQFSSIINHQKVHGFQAVMLKIPFGLNPTFCRFLIFFETSFSSQLFTSSWFQKLLLGPGWHVSFRVISNSPTITVNPESCLAAMVVTYLGHLLLCICFSHRFTLVCILSLKTVRIKILDWKLLTDRSPHVNHGNPPDLPSNRLDRLDHWNWIQLPYIQSTNYELNVMGVKDVLHTIFITVQIEKSFEFNTTTALDFVQN